MKYMGRFYVFFRTSTLVSEYMNNDTIYRYSYDKVGNIVDIWNLYSPSSYEYDELNQLVRENNKSIGKTYTYAYSNGNITERKEYAYTTGELGEVVDTKVWSYGDSTWRDLLTDFNGTAITYDEIGNPLTMGSKTLTWNCRTLQSITDGENTYSYKYNGDGQRISKTVNGVETEYYYNGSTLAGQKTGDEVLSFMYDENGVYFGFIYNGEDYYFIKNVQNDVEAISDKDENIVVRYTYDAWGNVNEISGSKANTLGKLNPIRYRSYYYDIETNLYYLNSRYYSPEMCRFLNADGILDTATGLLAHNMFAYCNNNPVNMIDSEGTGPIGWAILVGVILVASRVIFKSCLKRIVTGRKQKITYKDFVKEGVAQKSKFFDAASRVKDSGDGVKRSRNRKRQHAKNVVNAGYAKSKAQVFRVENIDTGLFDSDLEYSNYCTSLTDSMYQDTQALGGINIQGRSWDMLTEFEQDEVVRLTSHWDRRQIFSVFRDGEEIVIDIS